MKIILVETEKVKENKRFREEYGDIDGLAASIKAEGLLQPITVDTQMNLIAGGRRLRAAQSIGLKKIPVIVRQIKGELNARELELIENIARKDLEWWEQAALEKDIFELKKQVDPDWSKKKQADLMGHSRGSTIRRLEMADVLEVVPELRECKTADEAYKKYKNLEEQIVYNKLAEDAPENVRKAIQWANDHYKVGDAIANMQNIRANLAHFAEVDPPYAVDIISRKDKNKVKTTDEYNEIHKDDYIEFIEKTAIEVYRILFNPSFCIWWFGMTWYTETLQVLRGVGFKVSEIPAIWCKGETGQTSSPDTMLASSYENFFICRKGDAKINKAGRSNVFHHTPVPHTKKYHPTEKSIELMEDIIETFTYPGGTMLVPFLGSGVTLLAGYNKAQVGVGWDLSEYNKKQFLLRVKKQQVEE